MRAINDKPKEQEFAGRGNASKQYDFNLLQQHVKQLEQQIKRLREAIMVNRRSAID